MIGMTAASSALLTGCVEGFFFHPDQTVYSTPQQLGVTVQDLRIGDAQLHGWWMPSVGTARATLVQAHGNAANLTNHAPLVAWLPSAGVNVLCFDYRGFGRSPGSPSLDGVVDDTLAALAHARQLAPSTPLVLLGQSLGGATSARAAASDKAPPLKLLVLDSAFASYRGIARDAAGSGPLSWLAPMALPALPPAERDPLSAIARLRTPLFMVHGDQDSVVPFSHGEKLHAAAGSANKHFVRIAGGLHLDALMRPDIRQRLLDRIFATP